MARIVLSLAAQALSLSPGWPKAIEKRVSHLTKTFGRHTNASIRASTSTLNLIPFTSLASAVTFVSYFSVRFYSVAIAALTTPGWSHVGAVLFFLAEFGLMLQTFLTHVLRCLAIGGRSAVPQLRHLHAPFPSVDIFITCCGEEAEVVSDTMLAVNAIRWPKDKFRVVLLDDGGDAELKRLVDEMRQNFDNVYYTARVKPPVKDYKAGNLNHGLKFVESLPGGAAEFVAALDVDMIPEPHWIQALMPHLLKDSKICLAQPPQRYYNMPKNDPLLQGLDVNYQVVEPLKHNSGVTWCGGSAYLMRRDAIDDIGGVPTGSVGEDMYISQLLFARKWNSVYINEPLQFGLIPDTYKAHTKQQTRWHVSPIQIAAFMRFYFFDPISGHMTFRQKFTGVLFAAVAASYIFAAIGLVAMPLALLTGQSLITYSSPAVLQLMVNHCFYFYFCNWLDDCLVAVSTNYKIAIRRGHFSMWMAPYHAVVLGRAFFLPGWLGGDEAAFSSTGSKTEDLDERDVMRRPSLVPRVRGFLQDNIIWFHLVYVIACLVGVGLSIRAIPSATGLSDWEWLVNFHTHLGWGPLLWTTCISTCLTPLLYALFPPTVLSRESLLRRDATSGAKYPIPESRQTKWSRWNIWPELQYTFCIVYMAVCYLFFSFE